MNNLEVSQEFRLKSKRIREMGDIIKDILEVLEKEERGCYHEELLNNLRYSDASFRPAIFSLYSSGFVDKESKGLMKFYLINENGRKLLKLIRKGM